MNYSEIKEYLLEIKLGIEDMIQDGLMYKNYNRFSISVQAIDEALKLIEKQKKELQSADHLASVEFIEENYISKDKIKIQIEQLESMNVKGEAFTTAVKFATKILEELLED